jgi:hypothetical protein
MKAIEAKPGQTVLYNGNCSTITEIRLNTVVIECMGVRIVTNYSNLTKDERKLNNTNPN